MIPFSVMMIKGPEAGRGKALLSYSIDLFRSPFLNRYHIPAFEANIHC